jgi:hypothetical protein
MSNVGTTEPADSFSKLTTNPKLLGLAGGILFVLGMLAALGGFLIKDTDSDRIGMVLAAAILLSFGYPLLLYVGSLKKIAQMEKRIAELELMKKDNA